MTVIQIIFYFFSTVAVLSALMVVISSNPVRGALALVLTFFSMAGVWLLLHAEFLALILVLVYVGAVMTLFLFVVMMLRVKAGALFSGLVRYLPMAIASIALVTGITLMIVGPLHFGLTDMPVPSVVSTESNTEALGRVLYTDYVYPFEIAAVMLLTAIVAAISLSHRKPKNRKSQNPEKQLIVDPKNRMRIVRMPSEKKISFVKRGVE